MSLESLSQPLRANGILPLALTLMIGLSGCGQEKSGAPDRLESQVESLEMLEPDCTSPDQCASVTIQREVFSDQAALNDAIYQQMLTQLQGSGESPDAPLDSLEKVAQKFLDDAAAVTVSSAAQWQLTGEAKQLARRGDVLTVEIDSYLYTGGAHGMPVSRWLNWDLANETLLALNDVIAPGQEDAFWKLAQAAHGQWLDAQQVDKNFRENWPFARTEDFRLTDDGLILLYGVYTLGPYSMGEVELTIPSEQVDSVLRERFR
ncbi:DUF3298 domain-containing protein [Microbulbifer elongatus]|uniref:DUF3298 domain-containing protein n=1 Tax=Microbulbifer elongatus TaxID=86173 RepID=A0ABT1NXP0_9GAMM|nr:DUF3298 and DUF4163 domain-containing protein [Microbulbifer elongatus]MCQ3828655.1 DUF3298 domain-containing protein [Microbulbifer elongatus]